MQAVEKLKTFNWKNDRPRIWSSCKFGVHITAYCISVSFFMTICAAQVYGENAMGLLICLLVAHFFTAAITIGELGEIYSIQHVFIKIEPETDIVSKSERLKNRCVLYACRVALVVIAVAVGFDLQFVLFSGAVFALSGAVFTCVFSYKVRKLYPRNFVRIVSFYLWRKQYSKEDTLRSSNNGVNPITGLSITNNSFDTNGNIVGRVSELYDNYILFETGSVTSLPFENDSSTSLLLENSDFGMINFNPASGLPMMNDTVDLNGDVFGTTSHADQHHWDDYHHNHDNHSWDDRW
ncbi:hypothetical protein OM195_18385 [Escherichia albertii]|nr:hypothetical protein [Escherichia albertii]MCZ8811996.1 hypothetical protein [Escherichia albertii]